MESQKSENPSLNVEYKKDTNSVELSASSLKNGTCEKCGKSLKTGIAELAVPGNSAAVSTCSCYGVVSSDHPDPSIRLGAVPDSAFRRSPSALTAQGGSRSNLRDGASSGASPSRQLEQTGISLPSKYEIISIREKHGDFRKAIPCMPMSVAVLLCLINVILPGIGTLFSSFTVLCGCRTEHETKSTSLLYNLLASLLQLVLAPIVVGWVWSVLWGITFINISAGKELEDPNSSSMV